MQDRGVLFTSPGDEVYEGMIVVNVIKGKQLTNVRASGSDENIILTPARRFTLEQAIDYIADDELIEGAPNVIPMRKCLPTENVRKHKPI